MLDVREAYCPGHFGNAYEAMWPREMAAYLAELQYWGFNRYSDWIDAAELCNPYTIEQTWPQEMRHYLWSLAHELIERKKAAFHAATELGLGVNLIITPNHVYLDQLHPHLLAKKTPRMIGQLLCPSQPQAREIILANFGQQFRDLAANGVELSAFTAFAYDFGGCACERCQPWILTFARLVREIHDVARRSFPSIEPWLCSWWWSNEEYRLFAEWLAREAAGWLKAMVFHIPYGKTEMDTSPVPLDGRKLGFVHIGYGDVSGNVDLYGKYGPTVAPRRLPATVEALSTQGAVGYLAYSEGIFDDVNKAILAALSSGRARTADEALQEYAARYFNATPEDAAAWSRWLAAWGDRSAVDLAQAKATFERLAARATPGWRLEHLRSKLVLEELDRIVASGTDWDSRRLTAADAFWAEQERLNRHVYRLGPVRYVISLRTVVPKWYESWPVATGRAKRGADAFPRDV